MQPQLVIWKWFIRSLWGVDRCSLSWATQIMHSLDPRLGSVLGAGMLPSVLMRKWTSLPTRIQFRLITGSDYTVEHRNGVVPDQSRWRTERGSLLNSETVAFQLDTSEQGYSPDPCGLGLGSRLHVCEMSNTDLIASWLNTCTCTDMYSKVGSRQKL